MVKSESLRPDLEFVHRIFLKFSCLSLLKFSYLPLHFKNLAVYHF